jgi:hypothetical protein
MSAKFDLEWFCRELVGMTTSVRMLESVGKCVNPSLRGTGIGWKWLNLLYRLGTGNARFPSALEYVRLRTVESLVGS